MIGVHKFKESDRWKRLYLRLFSALIGIERIAN
jgi:hypothetical protein